MVDSIPTTEFGDTARSMQSRKLAVANWVKSNEQIRPSLVRAGKVIIYKLLSHMPLNAPCLPLDRCIELSPSYIAKVADTSPQTARNAWLELRVILGWRELSTRARIGKTLERIGYEPRWPSGGRRWGTHVFVFSKLYTALQSISEWLRRSGRYIGVSCVPEQEKISSAIVRIVEDKLSDTNVDLDNNSQYSIDIFIIAENYTGISVDDAVIIRRLNVQLRRIYDDINEHIYYHNLAADDLFGIYFWVDNIEFNNTELDNKYN